MDRLNRVLHWKVAHRTWPRYIFGHHNGIQYVIPILIVSIVRLMFYLLIHTTRTQTKRQGKLCPSHELTIVYGSVISQLRNSFFSLILYPTFYTQTWEKTLSLPVLDTCVCSRTVDCHFLLLSCLWLLSFHSLSPNSFYFWSFSVLWPTSNSNCVR